MAKLKRVFGPVPSRRLGLSLGIDLTPYKTCSYNCSYCQLQTTTSRRLDRCSFYDPEEVIAEIRAALAKGPSPEYITFSGSGEPTLSADLGWLIDRIKESADIPICLITNGSLLFDPATAAEAGRADLIIPTLTSVDDDIWRKINEPPPELELTKVLDGLVEFTQNHADKVWIELMLIEGINDADEHLARLAKLTSGAGPAKIQLNTVERPPRLGESRPLSRKRLDQIAVDFDFGAPVEVIARRDIKRRTACSGELEEEIMLLLQRHPARIDEIADALGCREDEVETACRALVVRGNIKPTGDPPPFFVLVNAPAE